MNYNSAQQDKDGGNGNEWFLPNNNESYRNQQLATHLASGGKTGMSSGIKAMTLQPTEIVEADDMSAGSPSKRFKGKGGAGLIRNNTDDLRNDAPSFYQQAESIDNRGNLSGKKRTRLQESS